MMHIRTTPGFPGIAVLIWILTMPLPAAAGLMSIDLSFEEPLLETVPDGSVMVTAPGCVTFNEPGLPLIPARRIALLLPPGEGVADVRAIVSQPTSIEGSYEIAYALTPQPTSLDGPPPATLPDPSVYGSDSPYPAEAARLVTEQIAWGHRIAYFRVYPVAVQPLSGRITWHERITLEVETASLPGTDPGRIANLRRDEETISRLREMVDNPQDLDLYANARPSTLSGTRLTPDFYPYVIVTVPTLADAYLELARYESGRGLRARIVLIDEIAASYEGRDQAEQLRNFIIDAYMNWQTRYVMLGGDHDVVPVRNLYCDAGGTIDAFPGDCYFEGLDGDWNDDDDDRWGEPDEYDLAGELAVGRVTAANPTDLARWMHKNAMYAEEPVVSEIQKALFMGERMDDVPTYACIYMEDVANYSCDHGFCTSGYPDTYQKEMLCDGPAYDWTGSDAIALFNQGFPTSHHLGHANTTYGMKMSNPDVTYFTNNGIDHSYTFMSTQGCYSSNFDNVDTPCLAEVFTWDEHCAAAFLGNTRYGWYCPGWDTGPSQNYDRQFVDARYGEQIVRIGDANVDSKIDNIWQMDPWNLWCHYELCLIGDPAMPQWKSLLGVLSIEHAGSYVMGQGNYSVIVRSGGFPAALAAVTIYSDDLSVCVTGTTDLLGRVTLNPDPQTAVTLHIKAVKADHIPGTGSISVDPGEQPWIEWEATVIDDDDDGTSVGDGDGEADMGETEQFAISLRNIGHVAASNARITLSCDDQRIVIADPTASFGTILPLSTATNLDDLIVQIPLDIVDQEVVHFEVEITCDDHAPWMDSFDITLHAPIFSLHSWSIDDTAYGNGEGDIDPAEVFHIRIALANSGSDGGREIEAVLTSDTSMLSFSVGQAGDLLLPPGEEGELAPPFQASLDINMPTESFIHFDLHMTTWCGQTFDADFDARVASYVEDLLEAESGWTVGAAGDNATQGIWVRGDPVGTWRFDQPVQPEEDHTPEGIACFVTGQGNPDGSANLSDVDGGKTTLVSPIYDLSDAVEPKLVYWRWYTNNLAQFPNEEVWQVDVSSDGGASWTNLEQTAASDNQWRRMEFVLADYITLTGAVCVRFIASDYGYDSLVEAAIDDVSVESLPAQESADESAGWVPRFGLDRIAPNPYLLDAGMGRAAIEFAIPSAGSVDLRLFDVSGMLVRTLSATRREAGLHRIEWDGRDAVGRPVPAGLYFLQLRAAGETDVRKIVLLR